MKLIQINVINSFFYILVPNFKGDQLKCYQKKFFTMFNHCVYMLLINLFLMPTIKAKTDVIIMSGNKLYAHFYHIQSMINSSWKNKSFIAHVRYFKFSQIK